jgi:hypothetical protein
MATWRPPPLPTPISKSRTLIDKQKFKSYQKAKDFKSSNPFFISFLKGTIRELPDKWDQKNMKGT